MKTKIYGHRGAKGTSPENTLLSFKEAIDMGVDGLEIDVHLTKDGEVVVIHDEKLDRTTNGTGYIIDKTLSEIKQFSAGSVFQSMPNYHSTWDKEKVPTLQEVLELLQDYDIALNIELKTTYFIYEGIEEKVLAQVEQYGNGIDITYSAFHLPTLQRIKQLDPSAHIAWLLKSVMTHPEDYINHFEFEALHLHYKLILNDPHHLKGLYPKIRAWTVNDEQEMKQLLDLKVDTIITDYPKKALFFRVKRQIQA